MVQRVQEERLRLAGKASKSRVCCVPGCESTRVRFFKPHAFNEHIPGIFQEDIPANDTTVNERRTKALEQASRWLLGKPATVEELLSFLRMQHLLDSLSKCEISSTQEQSMIQFCQHLQKKVPEIFNLVEGNSVGFLVHWRVILLIYAILNTSEREFWKQNFSYSSKPTTSKVNTVEIPYPQCIDSHFHLDRTLSKLQLSSSCNLQDILKSTLLPAAQRVNLVGSVAVFCDPYTYPSRHSLLGFDSEMKIAVGIHPRHASFSTRNIDESIQKLKYLLEQPRVTAFGEIGLDRTEPVKEWSNQLILLEKVLPLIKSRHVLVLHCRGMEGDCGTEAFLQLLVFIKRYIKRSQKIYLHCFTGTVFVVKKWLEDFPETYFGFTNKLRHFNEEQINALKSIPENRLLLESDAPYFATGRQRVSSPGHLSFVAKSMAQHTGLPIERVYTVTTANARSFYWN